MVTSTEKDTFVYLSSGYSFPILPPSPVTKNNPSDDLTCVSQPINMIASWPVKKQMFLMLSMTGLKPVGCLRHWRVLAICRRMKEICDEEVSPEEVWKFIHFLYDVNKVEAHITDNLPFKPRDVVDFSLPETSEFTQLLYEKVSSLKKETSKSSKSETVDVQEPDKNGATRSRSGSVRSKEDAFVVEQVVGSSSGSKRSHDSLSSSSSRNSDRTESPRIKLRKR